VRNILLTVESLEFGEILTVENFSGFPLLQGYSEEEICYVILRLDEAEYFPENSVIKLLNGTRFTITSLTWDGHQFLDCIRDEEVWEKTRRKSSKFGSTPVKILAEIAMSIIRSGVGLPF